MRQWVRKLIEQFDFEWSEDKHQETEKEKTSTIGLSEDRATLLYIIDTFNKHLLEIDSKPVRKVRQTLDEFARQLISPEENIDRVLFRFRQFFSSYRIDEYTYVLKTFDDFRAIIWDFVDQLKDEFEEEEQDETTIHANLEQLREAVESNSIELLKNQSRTFIDSYIEYQTRRDLRRESRMQVLNKNLSVVKNKLVEANHQMNRDHLTSAYNRKSFDEKLKEHWKLFQMSKKPVTLLALDIDHFKRVNDTYGHAIGDFVLIELVKLLQGLCQRKSDFIARIGGEEFAIILPDYQVSHAVKKAEELLQKIRSQAFVQNDSVIRFTCSAGIAQLHPGENTEQWLKRADDALYASKNGGRDRYTISQGNLKAA